MSAALASTLLPILRRMDPERAHSVALAALRLRLAGRYSEPDDPCLRVTALGLDFGNPIGLAAGFDKNAVAVAGLARLGFGSIETGTVTLRPQTGNLRPRLFRLETDRAIVNRMGFNNSGLAAYVARLKAMDRGAVRLGANVGINKEGADPERDYPALVDAVGRLADYLVINVSSPNTAGLRELQGGSRLRPILDAITRLAGDHPALLVKIAPDLRDTELAEVVEACVGGGVQGLIVSNTTTTRPSSLRSALRNEAGGLSGAPLFALSTAMLARAYQHARGRLILVGAGGIGTGADAFAKIRAGAHLVQLYTAFAYHGPALVPRLKVELVDAMRQAGFSRVQDAVGTDAYRLAGLVGAA